MQKALFDLKGLVRGSAARQTAVRTSQQVRNDLEGKEFQPQKNLAMKFTAQRDLD